MLLYPKEHFFCFETGEFDETVIMLFIFNNASYLK